MKSYQFFKICQRFDKEREKNLYSSQWEKKNCKKLDFFIAGSFIKSFNRMINHFFFRKLIWSPIFAFSYQDDGRYIKRGSRERQIARNGKLQYLFQK